MTDNNKTVSTFNQQKQGPTTENLKQINQQTNLLKPVPRSQPTEKVILCS